MAWIVLVVAGLCEVVWAIGLKYTDGFTRLGPSTWTITAMIVSIVLLAWAMKTLPVGTAYAVWTGIGAVGTVILGIVLFGESASFLRAAFGIGVLAERGAAPQGERLLERTACSQRMPCRELLARGRRQVLEPAGIERVAGDD